MQWRNSGIETEDVVPEWQSKRKPAAGHEVMALLAVPLIENGGFTQTLLFVNSWLKRS